MVAFTAGPVVLFVLGSLAAIGFLGWLFAAQ